MMHRAGLLTAAVLILLAGCAPRASAPAAPLPRLFRLQLGSAIDSVTTRPSLQQTSWGILVADATDGTVLYEQNATKLFIPASNTKLVVAVTALARLGPEYRYRTPILAGARAGDTAGVVLLSGRGDPTWSARIHGSVEAAIDSMAGLVAAGGLGRIRLLTADASRFRDARVNPTWEVGDLPWQYAPPSDAVAAGEATFQLIVTGDSVPGGPADVRVAGVLPQPILADVRTDTAGAAAALQIDYTARRDTVYLAGTIGATESDTLILALTRPAQSMLEALAASLRRRGVAVDSLLVVRDTAAVNSLSADAQLLGEWLSPPLTDIVRVILQPSQNWVAEQVLKTLGAELGAGGTWQDGIAVERAYLHDVIGIDSAAVNLRDASGMSAQNLLTPRAILDMLLHARSQPWGQAFRASLAAPGLAGSTLNNRLAPLQGRLAAKTGTISNVNSLAGYLTARSGDEYAFVIMSNGSGQPSTVVRSAIDDIVHALARYIDDDGGAGSSDPQVIP